MKPIIFGTCNELALLRTSMHSLRCQSMRPPMIVLSRKRNESIVINSNIVVTVIEIRGDKVRLGIEAPRDCSVHRQEVWAALHRNEWAPHETPRPPPAPVVHG